MQENTEDLIKRSRHNLMSIYEQSGTTKGSEHEFDQIDQFQEEYNLTDKGTLLTYHRLARILMISESTLRKYVSRRVIPHLKIGRCVRFDPHEIARWLASHSQAGVSSSDQQNE